MLSNVENQNSSHAFLEQILKGSEFSLKECLKILAFSSFLLKKTKKIICSLALFLPTLVAN